MLQQAYEKMRGAITDRMKEYMTKHNVKSPKVIVDMGCSTGFSTEWLAEQVGHAGAAFPLTLVCGGLQ